MKHAMNLSRIIALAMQANIPAPKAQGFGENSNEIFVYDAIISGGWGGVDPAVFVEAIKAYDGDEIHLRIDSPGGDVFGARAMKTALEQHPAKVIAHIDGVAASAASFLMLAADEIEIAQGAFIMIHNAWSFAMGDWEEMKTTSDLLAKIDRGLARDYAAKADSSVEAFAQMMAAETWFDADEAKAEGLVDHIYSREGGAQNRFNVGALFNNTPKQLKNDNKTIDESAAQASQRKAVAEARFKLMEIAGG